MDCIDTLLTWCLYLAVLCGTLYAFQYQFWVGVVLTVPALLGDVIVKRAHRRAAFMVKLLLLFQTVMMWSILPWATFHEFDTAQMSPHVVSIIKATQDNMPSIPVSREMITGSIGNWIPKFGMLPAYFTSQKTELIVEDIFGNLSTTNFPDLKYRSPEEVRSKYRKMFSELPSSFDPALRNPCWFHGGGPEYEASSRGGGRSNGRVVGRRSASASGTRADGETEVLSCLPYVYLLGQPKSGTSDLYERLVKHPDVVPAARKEIRWFTRGEFTTEAMPVGQMLNEQTSIFSYTSSFSSLASDLTGRLEDGRDVRQKITVDGGPHTLWWPTQSPTGDLMPDEIPPAQIIREMQPKAKFLITLSDPVHRMYSDYYFLDDSLRPVANMAKLGGAHEKSPEEFHQRALKQVADFKACVGRVEGENPDLGWFRASQICAHDRKSFGVGGWGRLNIGIYVAFVVKWLEHFSLNQFHIVRLEDFHADPTGHMKGVFEFLELRVDFDETIWNSILSSKVYNQHKASRPDMLPETDKLLRDFYQPYNDLLAKLLKSDAYRWLENTSARQVKGPDFHSDERQQIPPQNIGFGQRVREEGQQEHRPVVAHKIIQPGVDGRLPSRRYGLEKESTGAENELPLWSEGGSFSLDGLDMPDPSLPLNRMSRRFIDPNRRPRGADDAAEQLCIAAFSMDLNAVKTVLVDHRVHGSAVLKHEFRRNAFHCLSVLNLNVDGHSKSHIFHMLKGDEGYLTSIFDPPLPLKLNSTIGLEIIKSLEPMVLKIAKWLLRAGAEVDRPDENGVTPLMLASTAGNEALVKFLIDNGANVNTKAFRDERTPTHYAAAYGHINVVKLLMDAGADINAKDFAGATARKIITTPGPIFPQDAKEVLGLDQRPIRAVYRPNYPSYGEAANEEAPSIVGGYDPTRLKGYENAMHCDADQYNAGEITGREIFEKYLARNRPILIRGLINKWPAKQEYTRDRLQKDHGDLQVTVTSIPYADKFHGSGTTTMSLGQYMDQVKNHSVVGGSHPWYVFIGHPLRTKPTPSLRGGSRRQDDEGNLDEFDPMGRSGGYMTRTHLVDYDTVPTPGEIQEAQELVTKGPSATFGTDLKSRKGFINAQWAYGGAGTGAPVHYHNTAWNALVYGAKYWVMYPPHTMVMSSKQILEFIEEDLPDFSLRGHKPLTCVQTAGDVMIIPESWSHGVLNIQESVAVATEFENFHWRHKPGFRIIMEAIPEQDRNRPPEQGSRIGH